LKNIQFNKLINKQKTGREREMKKALLILAIFSLCVAIATATAFGATLKGKKYGIFNILGIQADHTYHCADSSCWSWTGGESGGTVIPYTTATGNYSKAQCTSSNWGCRFVYAVQGVCHQECNRGLYTTSPRKTIASGGVGGYWLTGPTFGTYGEAVSWTACKTACWLW
jgi:hypothetical protein